MPQIRQFSPRYSRLSRQRGQALIYGVFVLMAGLASLFFLFNTGQLSSEKTKLVNTADAVAYSAGVMHARALNYEAYANRAMLANTVAIAQLVSLSSWVQYANNMSSFGFVLNNWQFTDDLISYYAAQFLGPVLQESLLDTNALADLASGSDRIIRTLLMNAQQVAYDDLIPARKSVMNEVARRNYLNDGTVTVDLMPSVSEFTDFVTPYSDSDRTRFADVAKNSAYSDGFVNKRSWNLPGLGSDCPYAEGTLRWDFLTKRGGTELIGFDDWKSVDDLSAHMWVPANKTDIFCSALSEIPAGWGGQSAASSSSFDVDPAHYDRSLVVNPAATTIAQADSSSWNYSGLPNFYELAQGLLDKDEKTPPLLQFSIRLRRAISETMTSEGRSAITPPSASVAQLRFNTYKATPAGGNEMVAVSGSEVYFERPETRSDGKKELASLFNPYWQVRLYRNKEDVKKAQAMQGAVIP